MEKIASPIEDCIHTVPLPTWNIAFYRAELTRSRGSEVAEKGYRAANSLEVRARHISFHNIQAEKICSTLLGDATGVRRVRYFLESRNDAKNAEAENNAAAHLMASMLGLHSISDLFAYAIVWGLSLDNTIDPKRLYFQKLLVHIKKIQPELYAILEELSNHPDFIYLEDLCNHTKHRTALEPTAGITTSDPDSFFLRFPKFERNGKTYDRKPALPYLEHELRRQLMIICRAGHMINYIVASTPRSL